MCAMARVTQTTSSEQIRICSRVGGMRSNLMDWSFL